MLRNLRGLLLLVPVSVALAQAPELHAPVVIRSITAVPRPGEKIANATIVIENGRITAIGTNVATPAGAREFDGAGLFAYAGFIDGLNRSGLSAAKVTAEQERRTEGETPSVADSPHVRTLEANRNGIFARRGVEDLLDIQEDTFGDLRRAGFTAAIIAPPRGVLGGSASCVLLGNQPLRRSVVAEAVGQTASFDAPEQRVLRVRGTYPMTLLGTTAHLRQTLLDAQWYRDMLARVASDSISRSELPLDRDLEALQPVIAGKQALLFEADAADAIDRVLRVCGEFKLRPIVCGATFAYRRTAALKAANVPVVATLNIFRKPREFAIDAEELRRDAGDDTLYGKNWEKRSFVPKALYDETLRERAERLGNAKALEEAGIAWCFSTLGVRDIEDALKSLREFIAAGLPADAALRGVTTSTAKIFGVERELGTLEVGKRGNVTILTDPLDNESAQVRWVFIDGRDFEVKLPPGAERARERRKREREEEEGVKPPTKSQTGGEAASSQASSKPASTPAASAPGSMPASVPAAGPFDQIALHQPNWPIETDADRVCKVHTGGSVLLKNAYVITIDGADLPQASVLIQDGKIKAIGKDIAAPPNVKSIDLSGYCVMPGIIDPHAHIALDAVNEWTLSVTPEVRCADVVDSEDEHIQRALAGGTTTIHAMHGSANTIGGQNVILKMKYGRPASELVMPNVKRTVKFALGENVKRPGIPLYVEKDNPRRFPGTRMGVEATIRRAFCEAREYGREREEAAAANKPLRRDLRLEALFDILSGDIQVHCHSYRADEILRLIDVAEEFGVRVAGLHHVLEGYRIMPEIARHGCGTATFADWWAYKIEAYQAVPYNAGMLLRAGICSTIKSDSPDLMRRLNLEAAKCMKYSGLSPDEALRLVTLNAARLFEIDDRVGSLRVGKDGDVAVFDGHPLDVFSHCVMTIVEGEIYFHHETFDPDKPPPARNAIRTFQSPPSDLVAGAPPLRPLMTPSGTNGHTPAGYAIVNATVYPVSSSVIERGNVIIADGKIVEVGASAAVPPGYEVIDAAGMHVYPGLINAGTQVGLREIGMADVTVDTSETGAYQPDLMAVSALNPHSATVAVTRAEGVTTALIVPSAPTIAGQVGLVNLDGWSMPEMLIDAKVGLLINLPSRPARPLIDERRRNPFGEDTEEQEREERWLKEQKTLARFLRDAKVYAKALRAAAPGGKRPLPDDPRFDALVPYVTGEKPVLLAADGYKAILESLLFAEQLELKPVILGGRDAWKLADLLAKRSVPVIYEGVFDVPGEKDAWDCNYRAPSILAAAGVKFCWQHGDASLAKLLPLNAGVAIAHGLDRDVALRAMTLTAAEILGVSDRLGSLERGKQADVVISTDHPCSIAGVVRTVFIRGRPTSLESQHTQQAAQFANRPSPPLPPEREGLHGPKSKTSPPASASHPR
ncbi:MAG: amidohydrolase family protein [Phycisphaerae bacterium]